MNHTRSSFEEVARILRGATKIFVFSHLNPDGDSIASLYSCARALQKLQKEVYAYQSDPIPSLYRFFIPDGFFATQVPPHKDFDLLLVLDTADVKRIPEAIREWVFSFKEADGWRIPFVNLDHHIGNTGFGSVNLVDVQASSSCEVLHQLFEKIPIKLTKEIASALYVGYLMDTGGFAFSNTSPETLRRAAELVESGASPEFLYRKLFLTQRIQALHLLGLVLARLKSVLDNSLVWSYCDVDDFQVSGATNGDLEGIPEFLLRAEGARVAIFFARVPEDTERIRVSFRSRENIDVCELARRFAGGGHKASSGARIRGDLHQVIEKVLQEAVFFLSSPKK
ncbi:MAG: DHH family phosphoesterase [bacterium JZ-2024 1]